MIKMYGDSHSSKAGDFELLDDTTVIAFYDASTTYWTFKGIDYSLFVISGHFGDELDDGLTELSLIRDSTFAFNIISMSSILSAGAITADLKIAGTSVTSMNAMSVTTTELDTTATGANSVSVGGDVTMGLSAITTSDRNFGFTIHCRRT